MGPKTHPSVDCGVSLSGIGLCNTAPGKTMPERREDLLGHPAREKGQTNRLSADTSAYCGLEVKRQDPTPPKATTRAIPKECTNSKWT